MTRADMASLSARPELRSSAHLSWERFRALPLIVKAAVWILFPDVLAILVVSAGNRSTRQKIALSSAIVAVSMSAEIGVRRFVRQLAERSQP